MKPTRITIVELEEYFETYVDRAAEGETFVLNTAGKISSSRDLVNRSFPTDS